VLRLEHLKVKADLERELETWSPTARSPASTCIGSAASASLRAIGSQKAGGAMRSGGLNAFSSPISKSATAAYADGVPGAFMRAMDQQAAAATESQEDLRILGLRQFLDSDLVCDSVITGITASTTEGVHACYVLPRRLVADRAKSIVACTWEVIVLIPGNLDE
jgi:hypothetical protein